ncbi:phosphotransferase [Pseudarthrobacter albicanus]|uniref:phosphotransferase n=1 Tax=Pseudarthrobacter albicanus TaxID=2823873 RepID=UPI001BABE87A|nr:phosphotransferase [Pseudarthrobacter albicanus]
MSWQPPVPPAVADTEGTQWLVRRAWPEITAGDYTMELVAPERAGVRAAHLRAGKVELLPDGGDRRLPALAQVAPLGDVVVHRAHKRAVVRAGDRYFKIFRPRQSDEAADRHARMNALLRAGDFLTPDVVSYTTGCLILTGLPGRSLFELGNDPAIGDVVFEKAWQKWSRGWVRQQSLARAPAYRPTLEALAPRTAAVELENLQRIVNLWLLHAQNIPAAQAQRDAVQAAVGQIAQQLLRTEPDPLVWSHGDLHDKQIFAQDPGAPLGLLDFDEAGRAEAAADLANLAVHLELRLRQGRLTAGRYRTARREVIAAAGELRVTPARFDAYANATRLRLGCLYSFRPRWAPLAREFLRQPGDDDGPLLARSCTADPDLLW